MADEAAFFSFLEEANKDYQQTQRDLREIDILIKQSAAEVERLAQRNVQATSQMKQLDNNFETMPRDYIREVYEGVLDVQQRLYTMRGQLEKLQSDQRNVERLSEFQGELLALTQDMQAIPSSSGVSQDTSMSIGDQSSIIRVIQTEEAAKQSLVREMHDGPASSLSNFILQAEICQRFFDIDADRARAELNALKSTAAATFNDVKDFIFDLRPMMLDDLGVVPTLRRYVETFQEKNDVSAQIAITGTERRLEGHIEVTIFRGVQELLNNAYAHGQASQIQASLDMGQGQITAVIEDNGGGFNVEETFSSNSTHIGLPALRERIQMLGGELTIQSKPGQGARAEFKIPIESDFVVA